MESNVVDELRALEETLWRSETRFDRAHLERVLHPEFAEFGASGRTYTRDQILESPVSALDAQIPLTDFEARQLADDVVLVTYVSRVDDGAVTVTANRSSLWVRSTAGWRLRFHQGTPTDTA